MNLCAPAGHRREDIFRAFGGCVYLCVHVGTWMCVKKCKEGNKSWMQRNHPGLSWCEEAGSKLGCSKMPKWTISHKPEGLVLIDPGWTGVGGLLVKYTLTEVTYCSLSLPTSVDL